MSGCCRRQSSGVTDTKTPVKPSCFILERIKANESQFRGPLMRASFVKGTADEAVGGGGFALALAVRFAPDADAVSCLETHCMLQANSAEEGNEGRRVRAAG